MWHSPVAFRARYVFPVCRPPIPQGIVTIAGGRIVAVGRNLSDFPPCDLGNVALVPGLVNAHTHFEFSGLPTPLGRPGMPFADWLRLVVAWRRDRHVPDDLAARRGLRESLLSGVAAIGEIATRDWWANAREEFPPLAVVAFRELIGLRPERAADQVRLADAYLSAGTLLPGMNRGLSPHATYTVRPDLLRSAVERSGRNRVPLAMHVAETREELQLLRERKGPLKEMLKELDAWSDDVPYLAAPLDYLRLLAGAHRALVIHGNYLADEDIDFLAGQPNLSLVYCPRTHAYFRHGSYPLARWLGRGARMALGTDSRASSPDLDLFAEMQHVAIAHPDVRPRDILEMGTRAGALALGLARDFGTLAPGQMAHLVAVVLPNDRAADPHELLFHPSSRVAAVYHESDITAEEQSD